MVARLPQQVLLLLVLASGTSAEYTWDKDEPGWRTLDERRSRWTRTVTVSSSSRWRENEIPVETSSPGGNPWTDVATTAKTAGQGDEGHLRTTKSSVSEGRIAVHPIGNRIDDQSAPGTTSLSQYTPATIAQGFNTVATVSTVKKALTKKAQVVSTLPTLTNVYGQRRQMRHVIDPCEPFTIGDDDRREFYSPNYPDSYPNNTDCVKVLQADEGYLLRLDFRDEFKLEDSTDCRFDYLEVRDGKYGFSNVLGSFCGTSFPPELTSKTRYLWLRFHSDDSIEGKGFKAVWNMIPRPTYPGVAPEPEPCIVNVTGTQAIIHSKDVEDRKKFAEKEGLPLDCMWAIKVKEGWKIQLSFSELFKLQRPNECDANFVDVFNKDTDITSREKNFCGSIADTVLIKTNTAHIRFYAEPKALNSSFEAVMTAIRDKGAGEKACAEGEYDCEDSTCIDGALRCNGKVNCRFTWDEDEQLCGKKASRLIDSQHIVIILVVFSLIMFGMVFAFLFNCIRKLVRDHRIIREHIRQSRENRLDELGRKSTPCPISASRTDIRDRDNDSPSLEVVPSKELIPPTTLIAHEYTKDLVLEMAYNTRDMNDIHQSNNVSNATQERLQESSEEPEMRDNSCQTRESLFETRIPEANVQPAFTTFGFRLPNSQNGTNHHHHHHHHHHLQSPQLSQQSSQKSQAPSHPSHQSSHQTSQESSQCSGCSPASRGRDGSMGICPKHNPIPAPPGWSVHEATFSPSVYPGAQYPETLDYPSYQRFQSPKPSRQASAYQHSPKISRQATVGSGERYGSSLYGSGHESTNTTSVSPNSGSSKNQLAPTDPRYRAEAVIEVDQRRPFSIESTKSAPDVIATH